MIYLLGFIIGSAIAWFSYIRGYNRGYQKGVGDQNSFGGGKYGQ